MALLYKEVIENRVFTEIPSVLYFLVEFIEVELNDLLAIASGSPSILPHPYLCNALTTDYTYSRNLCFWDTFRLGLIFHEN